MLWGTRGGRSLTSRWWYPAALAALGYPYVEETDNPACRLFLDGA